VSPRDRLEVDGWLWIVFCALFVVAAIATGKDAPIWVGSMVVVLCLLDRYQTHERANDIRDLPLQAPPLAVEVAEASSDARVCPFCKDSFDPRSEHVECKRCKTAHHASCFEEYQGCAVFGCGETRPRVMADSRAR